MKRIAALALGGLLAAPAFAGGPVTVAPEAVVVPAPVAVAPSVDWSGFYGGAQLGYADIDSNGAGFDGDGAIGGVHMGYRHDLGRAVLGAELAYDVGDIDLGTVSGDTLDNMTRLKLMAGGEVGDRALVYATAGAGWADATLLGTDFSDQGWFYGVGMDYQVTDRWTVGGEVLMNKFDNFDDTGVDLDTTTVEAKVSYRF